MLNKFQTHVEVELDTILHNANAIKEHTGKPLIAVVKADAYGHGAIQVVKHLQYDVDMFAVATVEEANELRDAGITSGILVLITPLSVHGIPLILNEITTTVDNLSFAGLLSSQFTLLKKTIGISSNAKVHVDINTGMNRSGIHYSEIDSFLNKLKTLPGLEITGVFTHLATADEPDKSFSHLQLERFNTAIENVPDDIIKHAANSAAALAIPESHYDAVRPGLSLYGIYPADEKPIPLKPALTWKAYISWIEGIEAGVGVSYALTYKTQTPTHVAGIRVGYGDGYPRALSNCGEVLINGKRCPIIGRICMDLIVVKLERSGWHSVGDEVVLIGRQGNEEISVNEIAEKAGTIPYEILTQIGKRVQRTYKENNN